MKKHHPSPKFKFLSIQSFAQKLPSLKYNFHLKKFSPFLTALLFLTIITSSFIMPPSVQAQAKPWTGVCVGEGVNSDVATLQGLECMLANIFLVFFAILGLAAFVMIVAGSIMILISGGSSKMVDQGKKTITFAIIGIVVSVSGFVLINLLSAFTGIDLLKFEVPRATETLPQDP